MLSDLDRTIWDILSKNGVVWLPVYCFLESFGDLRFIEIESSRREVWNATDHRPLALIVTELWTFMSRPFDNKKPIGSTFLYLAGPSGQHCRCYGVFDVSVQPVFWCSQCSGVNDIWSPSGIVACRHLCDCTKTSGVLWYRACQNIDCAKTLIASNHWQQQNIDRAKTSATPFFAAVFFYLLETNLLSYHMLNFIKK